MFVSIVRTIVPAAWAWLVGQLLIALPVLEPLREQLLAYAEPLAAFLSVLVFAAWYALMRWLEPRMPEWLAKVLFGSSKRPVYANADTITGTVVEDENLTPDYLPVEHPKHAAE